MMLRSQRTHLRRRGSALILAVAVLAVLAIFALTLGYDTRVELVAARNWTNGVQARMAAVTGIPAYPDQAWAGEPARLASLPIQRQTGGLTALRPVKIRLSQAETDQIGPTTLASPASATPATLAGQPDAAATLASATAAGSSTGFINAAQALAESGLRDASAKIDINAVVPLHETAAATGADVPLAVRRSPAFLSEDVLARFILRRLAAKGVTGVDAFALAHNIAIRRFGKDGLPGIGGLDDNHNSDHILANVAAGATTSTRSIEHDGLDNNHNGVIDESNEGIDDPAESLTDPRLTASGDDRPYTSLNELMTVPGMTPEAFEALAPYLTIFSASFSAFDTTGIAKEHAAATDLGFPQVDPNTATREMIFDALRARFPDAAEGLLAQFTLNIIDRRDADNIPTEWRLNGTTYLGLEENVCINEICSDVPNAIGSGDDGQFIELYNPYGRDLNVAGWTLSGAGPTVRLRGAVSARGYLILTNDFNEENDPTPEYQSGLGSFYKVFHKVPVGESRRIDEYPTLNLPDDRGAVELKDAQGHLIDRFTYSGGKWNGATRSFQRNDPRVRHAVLAEATPLETNLAVDPHADATAAIQKQETWQNQPFTSAMDVMLVSSAFGDDDANGQAAESAGWALPDLSEAGADHLNAGVIDCFRVGAILPQMGPQGGSATVTLASAAAGSSDLATTNPLCDESFGRLNLNTASAATLAALPGMTTALLERIVAARNRAGSASAIAVPVSLAASPALWWQEASPLAQPAWRNLSDFLRDEDVWQGRPLYDRLDAVYAFLPLVTTHSVALHALTTSRSVAPDQADGERRPTEMIAERVLADDRGRLETVAFDYFGRGSIALGDPDLRFAKPLSGADAEFTWQNLLPGSAGAGAPKLAALAASAKQEK